jgi:hypothetical protein
MKREREKGGKCIRKRKKEEERGKKMGRKGVKEMQNTEELRQKGHDRSRKTMCHKRGKKYHFQKGGGINIVFRPKYRPLLKLHL